MKSAGLLCCLLTGLQVDYFSHDIKMPEFEVILLLTKNISTLIYMCIKHGDNFFPRQEMGKNWERTSPSVEKLQCIWIKLGKFLALFGYILARSLNSSLFSNNFKFREKLLVFFSHLLIWFHNLWFLWKTTISTEHILLVFLVPLLRNHTVKCYNPKYLVVLSLRLMKSLRMLWHLLLTGKCLVPLNVICQVYSVTAAE